MTAAQLAALFGHVDSRFGGQTEKGVLGLLGNSMHLAEARVSESMWQLSGVHVHVHVHVHVSYLFLCQNLVYAQSLLPQVGSLMSAAIFIKGGML